MNENQKLKLLLRVKEQQLKKYLYLLNAAFDLKKL
jgi:hypothetical protein